MDSTSWRISRRAGVTPTGITLLVATVLAWNFAGPSLAGHSGGGTNLPARLVPFPIAAAVTGNNSSQVPPPGPPPAQPAFPSSQFASSQNATNTSYNPGPLYQSSFCWNWGGCNYNVCQVGSEVASQWLWDPIVVVNSPWKGSATGSSAVQVSSGFSFNFDQSNYIEDYSSHQVAANLSVSSGASAALFESDYWEVWHVYNQSETAPFWSYYWPNACQASWVPEITYESGFIQSYAVAPPETATLNIPNQVQFLNPQLNIDEYSLTGLRNFDYFSNNDGGAGTCTGPAWTATVTDSTTIAQSIGVTVDLTVGGVLSVSGGFSDFSSTTSTSAYSYSFPGYTGTWLFDSLNAQSGGILGFSYSSCSSGGGGGGGGGCVNIGTPILTPAGYVPVQKLKAGQSIVEFNTTSRQFFDGIFLSANVTKVPEVLSINQGELVVTPTDQPIWVMNSTFVGWLHDPQNLMVGDLLYDPVNNTWIPVSSLTILNEKTYVYDVQTSVANDYIANGFLVDMKMP